MKHLIPVDGSSESVRAVEYVIAQHRVTPVTEVVLLSVQPLLPVRVARFATRDSLTDFRRQRAHDQLREARDLLEKSGLPTRTRIMKGPIAQTIAQAADEEKVDQVVLGIRRKPHWVRAFLPSVTEALLTRCSVPVSLIVNGKPTALERFGLPAGVGLGVTALLLGAD